MESQNGQPAEVSGGLRVLESPSQTGGVCEDLAMVRRAVKEKWPMKPEVRAQLMARLGEIAVKSSVEVPGPEGVAVVNEAIADRNSIAAANVLRMMVEEDRSAEFKGAGHIQADRHHKEGKKINTDKTVRILVVDARGTERNIGSLREFYATQAPAPVRPANALPDVQVQAEVREGGATGG